MPPYNHLTDEQEIALGQKFAAEVEESIEINAFSLAGGFSTSIAAWCAADGYRG